MSVFNLTGRKALVTGGARGLGAGMAEALTKAGASVVIGDVLTDLGQQTRKGTRRWRRQGGPSSRSMSLTMQAGPPLWPQRSPSSAASTSS